MNYSIVVATRNRQDALRLSVPRMVRQTLPPAQLIVVDSSDDHEATRVAVRAAIGESSVRVQIIRSERGLTLQRNASLAHISEPVVLFPDDDSILFPDAAEKLLAIYARDDARRIAAACALESDLAPDGYTRPDDLSYQTRPRKLHGVSLLRLRWENRLFPEPLRVVGRQFAARATLPDWAATAGVVPVGTMTGFQMSFRTAVIRQVGFDAHLRRYALYEDRDASLGAWRHGAVVGVRGARVFHDRAVGHRDDGRRIGVSTLLNLAYIVAKHTAPSDPVRAYVQRYGRYKTLGFALTGFSSFARDRYRGARDTLLAWDALRVSSSAEAQASYLRALERLLPERTAPMPSSTEVATRGLKCAAAPRS